MLLDKGRLILEKAESRAESQDKNYAVKIVAVSGGHSFSYLDVVRNAADIQTDSTEFMSSSFEFTNIGTVRQLCCEPSSELAV